MWRLTKDQHETILHLRFFTAQINTAAKTFYKYKDIAKIVGISASKVQSVCLAAIA